MCQLGEVNSSEVVKKNKPVTAYRVFLLKNDNNLYSVYRNNRFVKSKKFYTAACRPYVACKGRHVTKSVGYLPLHKLESNSSGFWAFNNVGQALTYGMRLTKIDIYKSVVPAGADFTPYDNHTKVIFIAVVKMWGKVVLHEKGYRAQHMVIEKKVPIESFYDGSQNNETW